MSRSAWKESSDSDEKACPAEVQSWAGGPCDSIRNILSNDL